MPDLFPRFEMQPGYSISRILKGGWQLAGGHGSIDPETAMEDMRRFAESGITTFDCADIYTGVETLIGRFLHRNKSAFAAGDIPPVQVHTKYVPDLDKLHSLTKGDTARIIDRSLRRLTVDRLDLVQFHWWDYDIPGYVEAAGHLKALQQSGKILYIGVTNFDSVHLREILQSGVRVISNQVQYSLLDHRPEEEMADLADKYGLRLLCYGTLAGGFLSDRYLNAPAPAEPLENRSLIKYRLVIDEFGGWDRFQRLLRGLQTIALKHHVGISEIASAYVLTKPYVAGIIIGARHRRHLKGIRKIAGIVLDDYDMRRIQDLIGTPPGPRGPVYALERDRNGPHGRIMKYNLNT